MNTNPKAKRILCFGDSNTWGYIPGTNYDRYSVDVRWTGILQEKLGRDYEVIEDGVNSRTIVAVIQDLGKTPVFARNTLSSVFLPMNH